MILSIEELALLDELITADDFGRVWSASGDVCTVYDSAATAYSAAELASLLGVKESALDGYLRKNWIEHSIEAVLSFAEVVKFHGEGILLGDLSGSGPYECRLFTPDPHWKPGARREVDELHALFRQS